MRREKGLSDFGLPPPFPSSFSSHAVAKRKRSTDQSLGGRGEPQREGPNSAAERNRGKETSPLFLLLVLVIPAPTSIH